MSGPDCIDICDAIIEAMCMDCPHWEKCQDIGDEANHHQMLICLGRIMIVYPDVFTSASDYNNG